MCHCILNDPRDFQRFGGGNDEDPDFLAMVSDQFVSFE
ncbi:hypothetical protein SC1_00484 [Sphingopyxis sp. C-1]|nr:hypothetical protein SC1_00484 [Sphingopyxis sp. C-1]